MNPLRYPVLVLCGIGSLLLLGFVGMSIAWHALQAQAALASADTAPITTSTSTIQETPGIPPNTLYSASWGTAVGEGGIILSRYGDVGWLPYWDTQTSPTTNTLHSVSMISADCGVAVGENGTIISRCYGSSWQKEASPTSRTLNSVSMISVDYGTAVGEDGTIVSRSAGQPWRLLSSPVTHTLTAVSMVGADCGAAVGEEGTIISRCYGDPWQVETSPTTKTLRSVAIASVAFGKAVGEDGIIVSRADEQPWQLEVSPTAHPLHSVTMIRDHGYWAVGEAGTILFYPFYGPQHDTWLRLDSPARHTLYAVGERVTPLRGAVGECGTIIEDRLGSWQMVNKPFCISLQKQAAPAHHVRNNDRLTFTLSLAGAGMDVRLRDPLPWSLRYVPDSLSSTLSPQPVFSPTARAVLWQGDLYQNALHTITFQAAVSMTGSGSLSLALPIANTAWLTDPESGKGVQGTAIINGLSFYLPLVRRDD